MTKINRIKTPRLLMVLALLAAQGLAPFAGQRAAAQVKDQLESIENRLERMEQSLRRIEGRGGAAGAQERSAASARSARAAQFRVPPTFRPRALTTTDSATESAPAGRREPDRDRDDLTDAEEAAIGTDPDSRDTDGDALWDGWEVHTIDGLDLRSLGASPLHKDIFVEMDFMRRASATHGLGPSDAVLRGIEAAFAAAPLPNPDGLSGVNIHLTMGDEVPYDDNLDPYDKEFAALRNKNFEPRRARAFHYMIWADTYTYRGNRTSSGISMDIPHSEFIVTLGSWNGNRGGTDIQKIGTFIHELGHNLGRMHGGSDHNNYKFNHLSVMNYTYQTRGILHNGTRVFGYQPFALPSLDEGNLQEADGLGRSPALAGYSIIYGSTAAGPTDVPCHAEIDWNRNGSIDVGRIAFDLNGDTLLTEMFETPDEWSALVFGGGVIGERFPVSGILERSSDLYDRLPVIELTEEQDRLLETRVQGAPAQP
ncbi:MAG TPA: hypothetical protein VF588_20455 [Pyrinomonadaceae bacterium]